MNERNRDIGQEILSGLQEIKRGEHGRIITVPDIAETRAKVGLSQSQFCPIDGCICSHVARLGAGSPSSIGCSPDTTDNRRQKSSSDIGCDLTYSQS